jgi:hypothetical protein
MFLVAFVLIIAFSGLLVMFLSLSAAPLERIRLGKILGAMTTTAGLLLGTLFGVVPNYPMHGAAPAGLLLVSAILLVAIVALEIWTAAALIGDCRHDAVDHARVPRVA